MLVSKVKWLNLQTCDLTNPIKVDVKVIIASTIMTLMVGAHLYELHLMVIRVFYDFIEQ